MSILVKTASYFICCLAICFASASAFASTGNLEIVDGNLVDSRTGLTWKPLLTDQATEPPLGFRSAFFSELDSLLPLLTEETITSDSDIFKAFTFFTSTLSVSQSVCGILSSTSSSFSSCLSGWYFDKSTPNDPIYGQPHNYASFTLTPKLNAIDGSASSTEFTYTSASTLGPYYFSPSYTADGNNWVGFGQAVGSTRPLFVVSSVPEPTTLALLPVGLALLLLRKCNLVFTS